MDVFDLCDAVPVNPNPKHYRAELVKPADPYEKFRANIEANERRFAPSPHASIAAAVMQLSGKQWNLQWEN